MWLDFLETDPKPNNKHRYQEITISKIGKKYALEELKYDQSF